jgi:hypothetical protein
MTVTGERIRPQATVYIFTITALDTKVNGLTIISMATACRHGLMAANTKGITRKARKTERENIHGKMAVITQETGLTIKLLVLDFMCGPMAERTKATG